MATRHAIHPHAQIPPERPHPDQPWKRSIPRADDLTPRQMEVFLLLGAGLSTRQIAHRLAVTEHTVKAHTTRVMEVLGLESRLQVGLAAHAYQCSCQGECPTERSN